MATRKFTCKMCKGEFEADRSEEETVAEKVKYWGNVPLDQCDLVCDDCWENIRPEYNPAEYTRYKETTRE